MPLIFENALLFDLDPPGVESGSLRIEGGVIVERGTRLEARPGESRVDCQGAVVLPGMVNGHTHLYSALAAGMPAPEVAPRNFHEILQFVWWRLDRALDAESIEASGRIGALDALHCGTTTLIDHHSSPNCIDGALDLLERGVGEIGLRLIQCYETTDRNGAAGRDAGLKENARYLKKCAAAATDGRKGLANGRNRQGKSADGAAHGLSCGRRFAALVGAHAAFTCGDATLEALAELAREFKTGVHLHVAEDPCDEAFCRREHHLELIDRLEKFGLLQPASIFGHCTHLDARAVARVNAAGVSVAHNTRSNMNNAVGYAPLERLSAPVQLGTDGIGADMFAEAQTAWFKSRDGGAGLTPAAIVRMLANSARRAGRELGIELGQLRAGAAADLIITDYLPATPLETENAAGHLLFALGARHVRDVLIAGEWHLKDRRATMLDETGERKKSQSTAKKLWQRLSRI